MKNEFKLSEGQVSINKKEDCSENKINYDIILHTGIEIRVKTNYEISCGLNGGNSHNLYIDKDGEPVKVREDTANKIKNGEIDFSRLIVFVNNKKSDDAKIFEDAGFKVNRKKTTKDPC